MSSNWCNFLIPIAPDTQTHLQIKKCVNSLGNRQEIETLVTSKP